MLVPLGVTLLLAGLLATLVPNRGSDRDPGRPAVPLIGGWALLGGLAAAEALGHPVFSWPSLWVPCGAALLLGTLDDRRPLTVPGKLVGQVAVGLLLAWSQPVGTGWAERALWVGAAVVAQNVVNTFDHADGLVTGLLLGSPGVVAPVRLAALGFLPWNLLRRPGACGAPWAYLGDGGSHLAGVLLLAGPRPALTLLLPALDLLRAVCLRLRAGDSPFAGDRRHLGHSLSARGWPPWLGLLPLGALWVPGASSWIQAAVVVLGFFLLLRLPARGCAWGRGPG